MRLIFGRWMRYLSPSLYSYPPHRAPYYYYSTGGPGSGSLSLEQTANNVEKHLTKVSAVSSTALRVAYSRLRLSAVAALMVAVYAALGDTCDDVRSIAASVPRTLRTIAWAVRAGFSYKRLQAATLAMGEDPEGPAAQEALSALHTYWATRLLAMCRRNGGIYVKAGQFASAFGALPREYRTVLSQLEDRAVPRPFKQVRKLVESELGCSLEDAYRSFEPKATAAASLAQVHKAVLITGEEVAVKVQYPGLAGCVSADLATVRVLSGAAQRLFPALNLAWLHDELSKKLEVELDFRNEISNAERFQAVVRQACISDVAVPVMHHQRCTSRLITMEWITGCKINDVDALQSQGINPRAVGRKLVKLFGEMMFIHGYVHGDPHPGNVFVRPKGRRSWLRWLLRGSRQGFEVVLLDHGTYVEVGEVLRQQFCQLWCALIMRDEETQQEVATAMAGERAGRVLPVLLTHRARTREEERTLQRRVGINSFSDMANLLAMSSRQLVDLLRVNTVIRGVTNTLGVTMVERIRIFSAIAAKGLPRRHAKGAYVHEAFQGLWYRVQLQALLAGLGVWSVTSAITLRTWETILTIFGEALFD